MLDDTPLDQVALERARREILPLLEVEGRVIIASQSLPIAAVMDSRGGKFVEIRKIARETVGAMVLNDWIEGEIGRRVTVYKITRGGRFQLRRAVAVSDAEAARASDRHAPDPLVAMAREEKGARAVAPHFLEPAHLAAAEDLRAAYAAAEIPFQWLAQAWSRRRYDGAWPEAFAEAAEDNAPLDYLARMLEAAGPDLAEALLRVVIARQAVRDLETDEKLPAKSGRVLVKMALSRIGAIDATRAPRAGWAPEAPAPRPATDRAEIRATLARTPAADRPGYLLGVIDYLLGPEVLPVSAWRALGLEITQSEARILHAMIQARPAPVTRERLHATLCGLDGGRDAAPGLRAIDTHIYQIRRKFAGTGFAIRTEIARGYALDAPPGVILPGESAQP